MIDISVSFYTFSFIFEFATRTQYMFCVYLLRVVADRLLTLFSGVGVGRSAIRGGEIPPELRHGAPAAWLGTKGTYPIHPILRRRYRASRSLSRCRKYMTDEVSARRPLSFVGCDPGSHLCFILFLYYHQGTRVLSSIFCFFIYPGPHILYPIQQKMISSIFNRSRYRIRKPTEKTNRRKGV